MAYQPAIATTTTDILILGSGGAGLFAALHAYDANPDASILITVKGLLGKSGCTRMVQGGYNAVLHPQDSLAQHFQDTIEGGAYLNDQELAWTLVQTAPERIRELETRLGCFFDRNPDGTIHQKAFAGQSYDRTVHRGDLTGIEIMNRLMEQVLRRGIPTLEDHRAIALLRSTTGDRVAGALFVDMRRGTFLVVRAKATLLATGGGPTMYKIAAPSAEKTTDGLAMAYQVGARCMDMEMVQFHPTGLLVGESGMSGTVLEEGLRGAGGYLLNGRMERFMERYDPRRLERSQGEDVYVLRDELKTLMWEQAGLVRHAASLATAQKGLETLRERAERVSVHGTPRLNAEWQEWLNLQSMLTVSDMIVVSALARQESRGSHYRSDFPAADDAQYLRNVYVQRDSGGMRVWLEPVVFTRLAPPSQASVARDAMYLAQEGE